MLSRMHARPAMLSRSPTLLIDPDKDSSAWLRLPLTSSKTLKGRAHTEADFLSRWHTCSGLAAAAIENWNSAPRWGIACLPDA